jgi:hypothetical protein
MAAQKDVASNLARIQERLDRVEARFNARSGIVVDKGPPPPDPASQSKALQQLSASVAALAAEKVRSFVASKARLAPHVLTPLPSATSSPLPARRAPPAR